MYFYCICGKEGDLRVLLFRHLLSSSTYVFLILPFYFPFRLPAATLHGPYSSLDRTQTATALSPRQTAHRCLSHPWARALHMHIEGLEIPGNAPKAEACDLPLVFRKSLSLISFMSPISWSFCSAFWKISSVLSSGPSVYFSIIFSFYKSPFLFSDCAVYLASCF